MLTSPGDDDKIVRAYFQWLAADQLESPRHKWAFDKLFELARVDPERAWPLALLIVERTPEDFRAMAAAAGWLGDILKHHGPQFIERVEALSRTDPHFRKFLFMLDSGAVPEEIFARVRKTLNGDPYLPPL